MTELELEIARQIGSGAFLVYTVLKNKGSLTALDLESESGMTRDGIYKILRNMESVSIVEKNGKSHRSIKYKVSDPFNWKLQ